ncbi:MAG TPA: sensory rhodopsin transducer [Burkholderiales bacterium]|nr:sensory rhodopsin transducer [Burkholderiales bacterium]
MDPIGKRRWAIAEGYIPKESVSDDYALRSHETVCILNAGEREANVAITVFYTDRDPPPAHRVKVPPRRTLHLRFCDIGVPRGTDYASVIESDVPIVVQHTRLDSRRAEISLLSTIAYTE